MFPRVEDDLYKVSVYGYNVNQYGNLFLGDGYASSPFYAAFSTRRMPKVRQNADVQIK